MRTVRLPVIDDERERIRFGVQENLHTYASTCRTSVFTDYFAKTFRKT